ncbi:MAG: threonine ammonia-lyase [Gammaproteobacteria bacterium]|nr:threonine ammonia-lyase [Gammaproteobacteria bacterium]
MNTGAVSIDAIRAAASRIGGGVVATPCVASRVLSALTGAQVWLKLENLQFTASFKDRGALNRLLTLDDSERARGVVAMSAGNHAQAVAYHAQRLGLRALIVMPRYTPGVKVESTRRFGAEIVLEGDTLDEAAVRARQLAAERDLTFVHPYDDPAVIAGQGTVGLEMLAQVPALDAVLVPVGGGGLVAGVATAVRALRPQIEVVGVETERFPAVARALRGEAPEFGAATLAEGIAVEQPGEYTLPIIRAAVADVLLVDERRIEEAVLLLLELEKTVVEGAGAAGLAALLAHPAHFAGRKVGVVISGGNIDMPVLATIIERGLVRSRRLVHLVVAVRDVPGTLAAVTTLFAAEGANVVQVLHQRTFTSLTLELVEIGFVLQTRGPEHERVLIARLEAAGYTVHALGAGPPVGDTKV